MSDFIEWEQTVPPAIRSDALWKVSAYRWALFLGDLCWEDVTSLIRDRRTSALADQLYRSVGSIGANLAEGYSRGSPKDRTRFYEYSLGSARESRDWYYKGRHILGDQVVNQRLELLTRIVQLLLVMVSQQRGYSVREERATYDVLTSTPLTNDE
jgi:four helix bundle protein